MKYVSLILFFSIIFSINSKVLITTSAYNRPEFIELQYKTFKKFIKDDYEYIVFNDADIEDNRIKIESECKRYGIKLIRIPQEIHKVENNTGLFDPYNGRRTTRAVFRQGDVLTYMFELMGKRHNDIYMFIDSDIFITRPVSIQGVLEDYHIASACCVGGVKPLNMESPGPEICILNIPKLPHIDSIVFKAGFVGTIFLDPMHFWQFYLNCHPEVKLKKIATQMGFIELSELTHKELSNRGFLDHEIDFIYKYRDINILNQIPTKDDYSCFYEKNKTFFNYSHGSN